MLVEDEQAIAEAVQFSLAAEGYDVTRVADGEAAVAVDVDSFDLVLLDLMLPRLPGFEVCRRIRERSAVPVIMLTARSAETDRILGLEVGADDYVAKPFSMAELTARIRAVLRRRQMDRQAVNAEIEVGDLHLDLVARTASIARRPVRLTPSEFRLLAYLAARLGRPCSRTELTRELWQTSFVSDARACDTHVKNLRRKIEDDPRRPQRLLTVQGVGYMLAVAEDRGREYAR
jgi:two-component system response regulator RegX3